MGFTQGLGIFLLLPKKYEADWSSIVPLRIVKLAIGLLMGLAVALALWSWWDMHAILHDSHFQMVDISKRGMNRSSFLANIERFVRKAFWQSEYKHLSSDDAALSRRGLVQAHPTSKLACHGMHCLWSSATPSRILPRYEANAPCGLALMVQISPAAIQNRWCQHAFFGII